MLYVKGKLIQFGVCNAVVNLIIANTEIENKSIHCKSKEETNY